MVIARPRSTIGTAMLRLRSDDQLVALVRAGHEEAFSVIHERYRQRLLAYAQQMLRSRQDAEDVLQDVFERAYLSLHRTSDDRALTLRPWLYRIAHNRCIDQLRRPLPPPPESLLALGSHTADPVQEADRRDALRLLITDVGRLPDQQRSALLMRELGGVSYADVADALGVSVPAVKSLLVRARVSLVQAGEARDTACAEIRDELVIAQEGRVRPTPRARRHMRDCPGCRDFRGNLRGTRRQIFGILPAIGPLGVLARLIGGGSTSGGAAAAWGGSAATGAGAGGATGGGLIAATANLAAGAGHVATLVAATVVTAGGAAAIGGASDAPPAHHSARPAHVARTVAPTRSAAVTAAPASSTPALAAPALAAAAAATPLPATATAATPAAVDIALKPAGTTTRRAHEHLSVVSLAEGLAPPTPGPGTLTADVSAAGGKPGKVAVTNGGAPAASGSATATASPTPSTASGPASAGTTTATATDSAAGSTAPQSTPAGGSSQTARTSTGTTSSTSSTSASSGSPSSTSTSSPRPPSGQSTAASSSAAPTTSSTSSPGSAPTSTST